MNILVKVPSRGRPKQLLSSLSKAIKHAKNLDRIHFQLTLDENDSKTNNEAFNDAIQMLKKHATIRVIRGNSTGKIHACNRDMDIAPIDWDIVVLLSDDMMCQMAGWDDILQRDMEKNFPDLDGILWYNDGYTGNTLNTLCILGKKYFDRFGYIYHPAYKSLWCDNTFMEVGNMLNRQVYSDVVLFKHDHYINNPDKIPDDLYRVNDSYYNQDKNVYTTHKNNNFGLTREYIRENRKK